jgi:hypothetical protein
MLLLILRSVYRWGGGGGMPGGGGGMPGGKACGRPGGGGGMEGAEGADGAEEYGLAGLY